jgi:ferredoxin
VLVDGGARARSREKTHRRDRRGRRGGTEGRRKRDDYRVSGRVLDHASKLMIRRADIFDQRHLHATVTTMISRIDSSLFISLHLCALCGYSSVCSWTAARAPEAERRPTAEIAEGAEGAQRGGGRGTTTGSRVASLTTAVEADDQESRHLQSTAAAREGDDDDRPHRSISLHLCALCALCGYSSVCSKKVPRTALWCIGAGP